MKTKFYLFLTILLMIMIFALGCAAPQQKPETLSKDLLGNIYAGILMSGELDIPK